MGRQLRRVGEVMCQSSTHVNEHALNRLCIPKKPGAAIEATICFVLVVAVFTFSPAGLSGPGARSLTNGRYREEGTAASDSAGRGWRACVALMWSDERGSRGHFQAHAILLRLLYK